MGWVLEIHKSFTSLQFTIPFILGGNSTVSCLSCLPRQSGSMHTVIVKGCPGWLVREPYFHFSSYSRHWANIPKHWRISVQHTHPTLWNVEIVKTIEDCRELLWRELNKWVLLFPYLCPLTGHLELSGDLGELNSNFNSEKKKFNSASCSLGRACDY